MKVVGSCIVDRGLIPGSSQLRQKCDVGQQGRKWQILQFKFTWPFNPVLKWTYFIWQLESHTVQIFECFGHLLPFVWQSEHPVSESAAHIRFFFQNLQNKHTEQHTYVGMQQELGLLAICLWLVTTGTAQTEQPLPAYLAAAAGPLQFDWVTAAQWLRVNIQNTNGMEICLDSARM